MLPFGTISFRFGPTSLTRFGAACLLLLVGSACSGSDDGEGSATTQETAQTESDAESESTQEHLEALAGRLLG